MYFKRGWGEKGIEKSADNLRGQWVKHYPKVVILSSAAGLCFMLWP